VVAVHLATAGICFLKGKLATGMIGIVVPFVALVGAIRLAKPRLAVNKLLKAGDIKTDPITDHVAAVSCGIYGGQPVLDLDYVEDSTAGTDVNFVMTGGLGLIEVQGSAEGATFTRGQLGTLIDLAEGGITALVAAQKAATAP
jgi:ribonuclease PH